MSRVVDLRQSSSRILAELLGRAAAAGRRQVTGAPGVTVLGPSGDVRWPDATAPAGERSVRDMVPVETFEQAVERLDTDIAAIATSAGGGTAIIYSTLDPLTDPPAGDRLVGDTYYRMGAAGTEQSGRVVAWYRWDGTAWVQQALDESWLPLVNIGSGTYGDLDGVRLKAKSVLAEVLATSELDATTSIKVGSNLSLDGTHGIRFWGPDPDNPGQQVSLGGMGTGGTDEYWGITDGAGSLVTALGGSGITTPVGTFDQVFVGGTDIMDRIDRPRVIAYGSRTTTGSDTTAEAGFMSIAATLRPGRLYRVSVLPHFVTGGTAGARFVGRLRAATGDVGLTSTAIARGRVILGAASAAEQFSLARIFTIPPDQFTGYQFLYSYASETTGVYPVPTVDQPVEMLVEDLGPAVPDTARIWDNPIPTQPPPAQQVTEYTSEWVATQGGTYRGDGSLRTDTTDMRQGYVGQTYNGDQHGIALFTGNAVIGETDKTIAQALNGATIQRVEVFLHANHWYWNAGGTAMISAHSHTSMTNQTPNTTKVQSAGWPKPGGRWVDITSIFDTSKRGIWVGKTGTGDRNFYGWFNGPAAATNKPRLWIKYTR